MSDVMVVIGNRIAETSAHVDAAMHRVLMDIRAFDAGRGWADVGMVSCAHWLSWRVGWDLITARDRVRVAAKLGELPKIDEALRRSEVSYSKARAMVRVATPENEEMLLGYAKATTASDLEKICRKLHLVEKLGEQAAETRRQRRRVVRRVLADGMVRVEVTLPPEESAVVWAAIEAAAKRVCSDSAESRFDRADGLLALARGGDGGAGGGRRGGVEVVVTVPKTVLTGESDEPCEIGDGTFVAAETARRLACDAAVVEVAERPDGTVVEVGRKSRSIPAGIRRALAKRDPTCRYPGCTHACFVEGHHVQHWGKGGETRLENLVVLCTYHHGLVHEHGYRVELDELQRPTFFDPGGRKIEAIPPRAQPANVGYLALLEQNAHLGIVPVIDGLVVDDYPPDFWVCDDGLVSLE